MRPVKKFELWKEEEISGELGRHIDDVLDELGNSWMRFYSLSPERHVDEPHLAVAKRRLGKRRKRLDFRFVCRQRTPIHRIIFEAKALKQSGASQLLDEDGLGRILCGHYAREDIAAGLLGYVQTGTADTHAKALENELSLNPTVYAISTMGKWTEITFAKGPLACFRTIHRRTNLPDIVVYTTLLLFR